MIRALASVMAASVASIVLASCASPSPAQQSSPKAVRMTYFGISNWTFQIGDLNILMDGYMTRIPKSEFHGGGGGLGQTDTAWPIDKAAVDKIDATLQIDSGKPINLILTGHSHFDHSFDTPYWAKKTGAQVIGSQSTCYQVQALGVPASQCRVVNGGETIRLSEYVTMRVVRWNHSGTHETNPEQHDPVELKGVPTPDAKGNLHAGVAEDFPNGGGNRGYLFMVNTGAAHPLTFFVTNSGGAGDLDQDLPVDGVRYGSPLDSLRQAMAETGLRGVDLWIGAGGASVAKLTVPILKPARYVPNHLGSYFEAFDHGLTPAFADPELSGWLQQQGIELAAPMQYLDVWEFDANGLHPVAMGKLKDRYGLH